MTGTIWSLLGGMLLFASVALATADTSHPAQQLEGHTPQPLTLNAEAPPLTLTQVVEVALRNNGELKALREEQGIYDAEKVRAGLLPNPTIEVEANKGISTENDANRSLNLTLEQEFSLSGKRGKRLAVAKQGLNIYRWQLADRERVFREELKTIFYAVVLAEQRLALADRALELNRQLLAVAEDRLAAGDIPELEVNLVKVEVARSEGVRIEAAKTLYQDQAKLWTLMGLPGGEGPPISGDLAAEVALTKTLNDLQQLALGSRPDLQALQAENARAKANIALARAERIPNVTAGLTAARDTTAVTVGAAEEKETTYTVGMKLTVPIAVFDRNQGGIRETQARLDSVGSRLTFASTVIEREVATAYANHQNSDKVLALYRTAIVPQLEENLNLTREAYRLGEVGILAVIGEQKKFFEVNEGYLAALNGQQTALARLESAVAAELTGGVQ